MKATATNIQKAPTVRRKCNPPVLILGGSANALSITRSLGRRGIEVNLSVTEGNHVVHSRYARRVFPIPEPANREAFWLELLEDSRQVHLHGSVLFACNDEALEFVARHHAFLREHFLLDDSLPEIQLAMLDKQRTLEMAREVGVPVPGFWRLGPGSPDLAQIAEEIQFPVLIKPIISHLFRNRFNCKHFFAHDRAELQARMAQVCEAGIEVMISELIPGPDSLLGSYYTYLTAEGRPLFHYTKKIIRRFPKNQGLACYHYTEWDEEIAAMGRRFFEGIGFRGLGNIEFKRDVRDGKLKVIECNARFTAAQELLVRSGLDIAFLIYRHVVGQPLPPINGYKQYLHYWYPGRDFRAFRELNRLGELRLGAWLRSIMRPQVLPYFSARDPLPSLIPLWQDVRNKIFRRPVQLDGR